MSFYDDCRSGLIQRGEELFPFNCFKIRIDWGEVLVYLESHGGPKQGGETAGAVAETQTGDRVERAGYRASQV